MNAPGAGMVDLTREQMPHNVGSRRLGDVLLRRKWQILVMFAAITGCVVVATILTPKKYESRMKILLKNDRADMIVTAGSAQLSQTGEVNETELNTEIELLNNNDLLQTVARACSLNKPVPGNGKGSDQAAMERAVQNLRAGLSISAVRKANIIDVRYMSENPRQAVTVLRQLAQSYLESHLRLHGTPGSYRFYTEQTERYAAQLADADARLTEFRQQNDVLLFPEQKEDIVRKESEATATLMATEAGIGEHNRRLASARAQMAATEPRVITQNRTLYNQSSVEHLSTMLVDFQNRRTELLAKFNPDDRLVLQVSQQIADTQAALEKAKGVTGSDQTTDVNPVRATLELEIAKERDEAAGIDARRQALTAQVKGYRSLMRNMSSATTQYEQLIRNRKEAEDNYSLYRHKTEEARIADSLDRQKIGNVAIAENPVEPQAPSKPNVPENILLGTLMAGLLSVGTAWLMEYVAKPVPSAEVGARELVASTSLARAGGGFDQSAELEALTGLPVFVVVRR